MNDTAPSDAAWVVIKSPLPAAELRAFCADIERLFRINSQLRLRSWRQTGDADYFLEAANLAIDRPIATALKVAALPDGWRVAYANGLKTATEFRIAATNEGPTLTITDDYSGTPAAERGARLDEVDRSLVTWGHDISRYLRQWRQWSWCPPWRWYMRRVWQPMTPIARRVAYMLYIITALELAAFLAVIAIYWLEAI
jgi:hypothetical protein